MEWHFERKPLLRFDVCYATKRGSDVQVFGFYFSKMAPGFTDNPDPIETGMVAGHKVTWFRRGSNFNVGPFSRHATIAPDLESSDYVLIELYADTEAQLQSRLKTLRETKLKLDAP